MAQNGLQANGTNKPREAAASPYASTDPNSNVSNFKIIESTLRGEKYITYVIYKFLIKSYLFRG
jgi:homocitrate synthase